MVTFVFIRLDIAETPRVVFITVQIDKFSAAVRTCSVTGYCRLQTVPHYGSIECKTSLSVLLALDIQLMPATKKDLEIFHQYAEFI